MQVETVMGVAVKSWTCSERRRWSRMYLASSTMFAISQAQMAGDEVGDEVLLLSLLAAQGP